mmetsp:Transcript_138479/g.244611  ORF Transcript_138479/g.244611 Transcript_138479/m.244611 type:complete len:151 (+) Transcript_138479:622-1074(+)
MEVELPKIQEAIKFEIDMMRELDHPNIVGFCGVVLDDPEAFSILMEYSHRGSLRDMLQTNKNGIIGNEALQQSLAKGIAAGMEYLHDKLLLHRDVKSDNVLMFDGPDESMSIVELVPKISDFGISKTVDAATRTQTKKRMTIKYAAPELL